MILAEARIHAKPGGTALQLNLALSSLIKFIYDQYSKKCIYNSKNN